MDSVYVLDQSFNLIGVVDEYVSIIWRPAYFDVGDFEIYLGATDRALALLQENNYVVRSSDISVDKEGNTTYKRVMVIKNLQLITDVENGDFLTVTGRELKYLLHQRIIWKQTNLYGNVENAIRRLVTENAINPTDSKRIIPNLALGDRYVVDRVLPAWYTPVEYIESSGAQYIDTGFAPDQDTAVEVTFETTQTGSSTIIGADDGWHSNGFGVFVNNAEYGTQSFATAAVIHGKNKTTAKLDKNVLSVNGAALWTANAETFQTSSSLSIFALNRNGTPREYATMKLYACRVYDKGALARDFIPCKNPSGAVGLYDLVTQEFYSNAGTGAFAAGDEYTTLADSLEKQITGDYLDQAIVDICTAYNYGWDIYIYNQQLVFSVYAGLDRSYNQNERPYVVFSDDFENLYNTDYQLNTEQFSNTALIGGEGEGVDRIYTTLGNNNTGLARYETFVDVRDVSQNKGNEDEIPLSTYYILLQEKGLEHLSALAYTEGFSGELLSDVAFKYGTDFYLGDLVTVINKYGISRNVRVLSAIESEDESGTKLVPQFNI